MNITMLKGIMLTYGDSPQDLANALHIHRTTLSSKMHESGTAFTKKEMTVIKERYRLTTKQFYNIFFAPAVSEQNTAR